nr:MaoC/PaaZ C-terminal domain-containing protein [Jonesia quinghaiensis]
MPQLAGSVPEFDSLELRAVVAQRTYAVERSTLVRYAGASGDFNPIHWSDHIATNVGLDSVIAHGMHTMGAATSVVEDWVTDQRAILDSQTRFARPIPVPHDGETSVDVTATVGLLDADKRQARIDLTVVNEGNKVLAKAQVLVQLR